ncbi:TcdA/TcdB pore-forming domain-containing protein [Pseudomonas sp. McL0111]|uniref:TcdA/TcdB pore-forming domain-containing protein n=1 Tax=Pseudomonas sp. McL0111 TaxID=3457357 RepID=UPI00403E4E69
MNSKNHGLTVGSEFSAVFERTDLASITGSFPDGTSREQMLRYYDGAVVASDWSEQLTAVRLLKELVESIGSGAPDVKLKKLSGELANYHARLSGVVQLLSPGKPVARKLHFAWVGGGIGNIQADYINVWKQMTDSDGYRLNLWYDSDGLLAHETNKVIVESAKAQGAIAASQHASMKPGTLGNLYVERARALRQQMFEYIQKAIAAGGSADQARIDLLVSAYGQDEAALNMLKVKNLQSIENVGAKGIALRNIRAELSNQPLFDIYERELSFRGNLAAASDITRLQALLFESGTYLDADLLPSLHAKIGGIDISGFDLETRMGIMQVLLDQNPQILPSRRLSHADFRHKVPEQVRNVLTNFARTVSSLQDIFAPFNEVVVSEHGLRAGNKNNAALNASPFNGLSNAMLSSHAGSAALVGIIGKIRNNYAFLDRVVELARSKNISLIDSAAFSGLIIDEMKKMYGPDEWVARQHILKAVTDYDADGIKFGADSAIAMSGPTAVSQGLNDFVKAEAIAGALQQFSDRVDLRDGFNMATEEETHHSWKDNARTEPDWFELETSRIADDAYKNHYLGNVDELLRAQTLTFKQGWPVIEGKPVLLTSVLQQLLDSLGEPFVRAMNDRLTGDIALDAPFSIDFETRQQIRQQLNVELPPSTGAESLGNLNEALARIASGKLPVDQLSPLHRVMFGGLFGASTLDQEGFAAAWKTTVDLAEHTSDLGLFARYDAIEQTLLKRSAAPLEFSASKIDAGGENSRALKAQAFAKPMSVRQWQEHVSQVETVAKKEQRASILTRGNAVRERFFLAGASSAKQFPQGLLIQGLGDPGRRCYPLALAMAAALEKGVAAERTLIGKLALANIAPDTAETHALLHVLDELRGIPMAQFGEKRPAANLETVMQALSAKDSAGSLLLNTDNHSMLVSKVAVQGETSYRFYDPNFGLYAFSRIDELQKGLQGFFQEEAVARLYGVTEDSNATFDVVDLDGVSIADTVLPSKVSVGNLLSNEPVAGGTPVEPWRHHSQLRLRSLSENARLGQAFASMDARKWTQIIKGATDRLHEQHQLTRDFVPVFESLKPAAQGGSEITLVNAKDLQQTRTVLTDDKRLSGIKSYLSDFFEKLSGRRAGSPVIDPTDVGAVHTLNTGFAIQALLFGLKGAESADGSTALTSAVRIHGYLTYAQLAHGLVVDAAQLLGLVRHVFTDSLRVANTTRAMVGNALGSVLNEGVGNLLQWVSIGFDIYLLVNAENDTQRAVFATQLAFDTAGLALGAGAFGAGLAGAGTAAAFLGGASVILGGLAIGIGALVEGFSARTERAVQIGKYLNEVHKAYRSEGYSVRGDTFFANPHAVYSQLDLRDGFITFGSQKIFGADNYSDLHPPRIDPDRDHAFSIRETLDLPAEFAFSDKLNVESVVLPSLPDCFLAYEFGGLPFSTTLREDLETALALEHDRHGKRQFWFTFYKFPTEYIIEKMVPNYVATTISVVLGRQHRFLHVPTLPREVHGHLSYEIDALGGHCSVTLAEGVKSLRLQVSTGEAMSWSIRAAWLNKRAVKIEGDLLQLGSINVQVPGKNVVFLQLDGHSYQVDWANETLLLTELEAGPDEDGSVTRQRVRELARSSHLTEGPTVIRNYHDALTGVRTTAWYDRSEDSFLLVRGLEPKYAADICMGPRIGQHVYYYCPSEALVWRVDVITGQIKRVYRLIRTELKAWISDVQQLPDGQLRVIRRIELDENRFLKMTYLIGEDELSVTSVSGYLSYQEGRDIRRGSISVADFLEWYLLLPAVPGVDDERAVGAGLSRFITVDYMDWDLKEFHRVWVRSSDGKVFRPILDTGDDLADVFDWELLDPQQSEDDTVLFRSLSHHLLYRQHIGAQHQIPVTYAEKIVPLRVQLINRLGQQYIVIAEGGMVFHMNALGESRLAGLSKDWQFARRYYSSARLSWWDAVLNTAGKWSSENVEVGGIGDTSGNTFLYVVCLGQQFLVADTAGKALTLLRPTQDHKAVWLLDSSSGRIYRQAFMGRDSLSEAFGAGTRLFRADLIPTMQRVLPQRTFAWAVPHASGLRAKTHDHVLFDLFEGKPPRIVGVENEFFESVDSREVREQKLAQLLTGQRSAPFLFMDRIDDLCSWYDVSAGRLLHATAPSNALPGYLGVANGQTLLLHDSVSQQLFSNRSDDGLLSDVWMTVEKVSRVANTLVIESGQSLGRIAPIPDGVDTLILRYAKDGADFSITQETWARLDCLIVDFDFPDAVRSYLMLKLAPMERWLVTLEAGHLLLTDPDTGRSIILRNAGTINVASQKQVVFSIPLSGDLEVTLYLDELMAALQENTPSDFGALISLSVEA